MTLSQAPNILKGWPTYFLVAILCGSLAGLAGCAHPCPNVECDWAHVYQAEQIPPSLEFDAADGVIAPLFPSVLEPATVSDAERTPFFLSRAEAFAMALEKGNVGA